MGKHESTTFYGLTAIELKPFILRTWAFINQSARMDDGKTNKQQEADSTKLYTMRPRDPTLLEQREESLPKGLTVEQARLDWQKETRPSMLATYYVSSTEPHKYGTKEILEDNEDYLSPGLFPLYPNGDLDFAKYKRNLMVKEQGGYYLRHMQDGPGVRRYWQHNGSKNWLHWTVKGEPNSSWEELHMELDTEVFNEHVCFNCGDWFECSGTHKNIDRCACYQLYYPTPSNLRGWKHYCTRTCRYARE